MTNWREVPFFRLLIPFVLGIVFSLIVDKSFSFFNYLLIFLLAFFAYAVFWKIPFHWKWVNGILLNVFLMLFGFQIAFYHNDWNQKNHFRYYLSRENYIIGLVDNAPSHKARVIQVNLKMQQIGESANELEDCSGTILLSLRNDTINQEINYGDLICIKTNLRIIQKNPNPEAFDYGNYLRFKNIHYQAYVNSDSWTKLNRNKGSPILAWAFNAQNHLREILEKYLTSIDESAIASALILGYKQNLSQDLRSAYSDTGAMHVLAVSGLHVGLVWGILAFILKWIRWRHPAWRWIRSGLTILGLWIFALITGASPSVLRAATMFSFLIIGNALERNGNIYNTLAASAFCLLLFNPYLIVEVGFQLSYLAVIGIVYFYKKIYNLWYIENRVGDYLWTLTAVAFAAQLSTFPLTLYYFHQFPIYFWLSGLVVVPFAFFILGLGLILFFTETVIPILSPLIAKLLFAIIWVMNAMIFLVQQLPDQFFKSIWIGVGTMALLFLMMLSVVFALNSKNFKWLLSAIGFLVMISFSTAFVNIENQNQKTLVVYHLKNKSYLECLDGERVFAFGDREIEKKNLNYSRRNFQMKRGITEIQRFHFGYEETAIQNWFLKNNCIQFYDRRIAFIEELPKIILPEKIKLDYILFRRDTKIQIKNLKKYFDFNKIIFDGALKSKDRWRLIKECEVLNIDYHDTKQTAFVLEL